MASWSASLGQPGTVTTTRVSWAPQPPLTYQVSSSLVPSGEQAWLAEVIIRNTSTAIRMNFSPSSAGQAVRQDLSSTWETSGTFSLTVGSFSISVAAPGDESDPYEWTGSQFSGAQAFIDGVQALPLGSRGGSLTLNDGGPPPISPILLRPNWQRSDVDAEHRDH